MTPSPIVPGHGDMSGAFAWTPPSNSSSLDRLITGPDGNLWLPEGTFGGIAKFDLSTAHFTHYSIDFGRGTIPTPTSITSGPDGRLWFSSAHPCSNQPAVAAFVTAPIVTFMTP